MRLKITLTTIEDDFSAGHGSVKVETGRPASSPLRLRSRFRPTTDGTHRGSSQIDYEFDAFPAVAGPIRALPPWRSRAGQRRTARFAGAVP
jgi:hypothetical protein